MFNAFIYGAILAFGLITPLGVQNIFVFNQGASQKHFIYALPSILTAALCDTVLIVVAVLGISVIVLTLPWLKMIIFSVGFVFLLYMGFITWRRKPTHLEANHVPFSAKRQIKFAASVSLLNPHAILDTIGVIGPNALRFSDGPRLTFTLACILVSFCWFFSLAIAGHFLHRLDKTGLLIVLINKISALIIWCVAFFLAWELYLLFKGMA